MSNNFNNKVLTGAGLIHYDEKIKDCIQDADAALQDEIENNIPMKEVTYTELLAKVNNGKLVPGQQYRITDYVTTTSWPNTQSAGHAFDVIVTADTNEYLNHNARVCLHDGDTYFADYDVNAWKIKYTIFNEKGIYTWADTANGKGVIYEMIDEYGNRAGYDFKNIQYKCMKITSTTTDISEFVDTYTGTYYARSASTSPQPSALRPLRVDGKFIIDTEDFQWRYTFDKIGSDYSSGRAGHCTNNYIGNYIYNGKQYLPVIVLEQLNNNSKCHDNIFSGNNSNIITGDNFAENVFGVGAANILAGNGCQKNQFGNDVDKIFMGNTNTNNTFKDECNAIYMASGCKSNNFGLRCETITLESECMFNIFGDAAIDINLMNYCNYNEVGRAGTTIGIDVGCRENYIGAYCEQVFLGEHCSGNEIQQYSYRLSLSDNCRNNVINTSNKTIPISASTPTITGDSTAMTLSATVTYTNSGTDTLTLDVSYCFTTASGKLLSGTQTVTLPVGDTAVTFTENITEASDATGAKFASSNVYKLGEADIIFKSYAN